MSQVLAFAVKSREAYTRTPRDKDYKYRVWIGTQPCAVMVRDGGKGQMNEGTINDTIDHPAHYGGDYAFEPIKVIDAWGLNFSLGNVVKYVARCGKKKTDDPLEDLKKARWYLAHEIDRLEREKRKLG